MVHGRCRVIESTVTLGLHGTRGIISRETRPTGPGMMSSVTDRRQTKVYEHGTYGAPLPLRAIIVIVVCYLLSTTYKRLVCPPRCSSRWNWYIIIHVGTVYTRTHTHTRTRAYLHGTSLAGRLHYPTHAHVSTVGLLNTTVLM